MTQTVLDEFQNEAGAIVERERERRSCVSGEGVWVFIERERERERNRGNERKFGGLKLRDVLMLLKVQLKNRRKSNGRDYFWN